MEQSKKKLGLLYKARSFLDRNVLLALYYSFLHTCINYLNIAWESIYRKKLWKNMQYTLFLIKTNFWKQEQFLMRRKFLRFIS